MRMPFARSANGELIMKPALRSQLDRIYVSSVLPRYRNHYNRSLMPAHVGTAPLHYLDLINWAGLLDRAEGSFVDLGASFSIAAPLIRSVLGRIDTHVVDEYDALTGLDCYDVAFNREMFAYFESIGIKHHDFDLLSAQYPFETASIDVVSCFHVIEHFHQHPGPLFAEVSRILKPGGIFVVAVPNAVNLRKRIAVLSGRSNYYSFSEWNKDYFRGHVREPVKAEIFHYMAGHGFDVVHCDGRNFMGEARFSQANNGVLRLAGTVMQRLGAFALLSLFPGLCSDLHIVGRKPQGES